MKANLYLLFLILSITACDVDEENQRMDAAEVSLEDTEEVPEDEDIVDYTPFVAEEWIIRALNYQTGDSLFPLISDFTNTHTQDMVSSPNPGAYGVSFQFDTFDLDADGTEEYVLEITYSDSSELGYKWINNKRIAIISQKNDQYEIIFDNSNASETSIDFFELLKESTGHHIVHIRKATGAVKSGEAALTGNHSFYRIIDGTSEHVLELLSHSTLNNSYLDHDFNLLGVEFKNDRLQVHYNYAFHMHHSELTDLKSDTARFTLLESDEIVQFEWDELNTKYTIHSAKTLDEKKLDFFHKTKWDPGYHQGSAVFIAFEDELKRQYDTANEPQKSGIKHALEHYDFY